MHPLRWLRAHDPGLRALRRAARVAIVMPVLFAFGTRVVGNADLATFSAFGSFAMLLLVDLDGGRRERVLGVTWLALTGTALVALGTLVSGHAVLAALTMVVVGFVVLFVGVVSAELAGASTALLLSFVLPVATPAPVGEIGWRMAGWLLAAVFAVVAVAFWWPAPARSVLREPTARTCRLFAERLTTDHEVAVGALSTEDRDAITTALDAAYAQLRDAFYGSPNRPTDLSTSSRLLVRLVDELGWLMTIMQLSTPVPPGHPVDHRVRAVKVSAADAMRSGADELDAMSAGPVTTGTDAGATRLRTALATLRTCLDALESSAAELPVRTSDAGGVRTRMVDSLEPTFRAQEIGFAVLEIATNIDRALASERRSWLPRLLGRTAESRSALDSAVERARAHLDRHSVWLHNSLRGATALGIAVLVANLSGVQHSFWVVLGTLSVLRSNALATGQTVLRGLLGTAAGIIVGGLLVTVIGTNHVVLWVLLPFCILLAGLAPAAISFTAGQAAFTLTLLIFFNIIQPVGYRVGVTRIEDIAIGCGVSLLVGLLFWPRGAASVLGGALAEAYADTATYLSRAVRYGIHRCERGVPTLPRPTQESTQAAAAARRLDDAFREYLAERGDKHEDLGTVASLVTGVVAPRLAADAVIALWDREDGSAGGDRSAAGHELGRDADAVAGWYTWLGESLTGTRPVPAQADRDEQVDERLIAAVRRDLEGSTGMTTPTAVRMIWTGDHLDALRRLQPALVEPATAIAGWAKAGRRSRSTVRTGVGS